MIDYYIDIKDKIQSKINFAIHECGKILFVNLTILQ